MQTQDIDARFRVERPEDVVTADAVTEIHNMVHLVAMRFNEMTADSREKSLVLTSLEEAVHWADLALMRNGVIG